MANRVRVRRDWPSALSWALALAVTMLAVYLITLSVPQPNDAEETAARGARVTREMDLEGVTVYFADLGVWPDALSARVSAAGYAGRGAAAVVYPAEDGFHVLGAGYPLQADAERIARRLASQEGAETGVIERSAPTASLRITASEADAEAIAAADRALRVQLNQAAAMALQIDRGELPASSARTLAKVAASEARKAESALAAVAGAAEQPVCAELIGQLESLAAELEALAENGETGAALSGRLRSCHVSGTLRLIEFLNGLAP